MPDSAPLGERSLTPQERDAYIGLSGSAGVEGAEALYFLGSDKAAAGDWPSAAVLWQKDRLFHPSSGWDRLAEYKLAQASEKAGDPAGAFGIYEDLLGAPAVANLPELSRAACSRLITTTGGQPLKALSAGPVLPEFVGPIRLRLLEDAVNSGRVDEARRSVDDYLKLYPLGPDLDQVEALSKRLEASVVVDPRALGIVVPLNGDMAAFGTQVLQGAQLAVNAADVGRVEADKIRLLVADEGDDTATAVDAATGLIEKNHVLGLLGPLNSDSAEAILPLLASHRTPLLSPSATRSDLADTSPWFFRDTLSPEREASAMADYAVIARRLTRVASLVPDDTYGAVSAQAFAQRIKALGGVVAVSVTYAPGTRDFREAMLALGGVDPGLAKTADQDEMRDQQAKVEEASNAVGRILRQRVLAQGTGPAALTGTSGLKLMVVDFSQDTPCAALNAGRAFSDRFARTLAQIGGVEVIGPQAAETYWTPITASANVLTPAQAMQAAQNAGADFVLVGAAGALPPDLVKWPNRGLFSLEAQLLDTHSRTLGVRKTFTWTQYQAPPSNVLGLQAIYLPAPAEDVGLVAPDMAFFDLSLPLLGSDQWDRPELKDHLGEIEGAVFTDSYWSGNPEPAAKAFDEAYRRTYAAQPGVLAAQAYDAAGLMIGALAAGVIDRASLRAYLSRVNAYDGVGGHFGFKGHQDAEKRPAFVAVKNGALILLQEP